MVRNIGATFFALSVVQSTFITLITVPQHNGYQHSRAAVATCAPHHEMVIHSPSGSGIYLAKTRFEPDSVITLLRETG
ncbi:hypothetical protein [Mangrovibacter phragmitis]|uniref:hypothetical protein n=1 Tax=Mangrovibacter phragmitis TaxID=1691903 RepID=UPI003517B41F